jgi:IS5 family transposase
VVHQTKVRIFGGVTKSPEKIVSIFEPHTEIIRKGKAGKPNEFGELVQVQEAENRSSRTMRYMSNGRQTSGC